MSCFKVLDANSNIWVITFSLWDWVRFLFLPMSSTWFLCAGYCTDPGFCCFSQDCSFYSSGGAAVKEFTCQFRKCKRCRFDPSVQKFPWRRKWQHIPVIRAWKIPWTEEPGRLQSMRSRRVRHNWGHTHKNILMKLLGHCHPLHSLTLLLIRVSPYSQYN